MNSPTQPSNQQHYSSRPAQQKDNSARAAGSSRRTKPDVTQKMEAIIHEIRNPLTAIQLANESLAREAAASSPGTASFTEIVSKNISRIEGILKQLLHANRRSATKLAPVDLCDVIEQSLQQADDRILLKKIKVIKTYGFDLLVNGVADQLVVAFLNILTNAIAAVDDHGKIWITVYRAKDEIKVIFKDNGEGMEPEVAAHIFERSFSRSADGLGIGLATVKDILCVHHASIAVNSEKGTGTSVIISFTELPAKGQR
jgi:signal transduction histidine kinase